MDLGKIQPGGLVPTSLLVGALAGWLDVKGLAMGGIGSGRPWGGKPFVEQASPLRIGWLVRNGYIKLGQHVSAELVWRSTRDRSEAGSIQFQSWCGYAGEDDRIVLSGTYRGKPFRQTVYLTARPCHLGGQRWYALCPVTERRCLVLVLCHAHAGWVSVPASGYRYLTEVSDTLDRLALKRDKAYEVWKRMPKRARKKRQWQTLNRMVDAETRWDECFQIMAGALVMRLQKRLG